MVLPAAHERNRGAVDDNALCIADYDPEGPMVAFGDRVTGNMYFILIDGTGLSG